MKIKVLEQEVLISDFPIPPSANHLYRTIKNRRRGQAGRAKTDQYRTFDTHVDAWMLAHNKEMETARHLVHGLLRTYQVINVDITFLFKNETCFTKKGAVKRHDVFNYIKALHDKLCDCLWTDDRYIWGGKIRKKVLNEGGEERAIIRIYAE